MDGSHHIYMKNNHFLRRTLPLLFLVVLLCIGSALPARAAGVDMTELYKQLDAAFGLTESDHARYTQNYAASRPIEYAQNSTSHYVALGAVTTGGLAGLSNPYDCYGDKIANSLNIQYSNLYDSSLVSSTAVSYVRERAAEIAVADLITFQMDSAPFITACMNAAGKGESVNWSKYFSDNAFLTSLSNFRNQMIAEYGPDYGEKNAKSLAIVLEYLLYECVAYCVETMNAVDEIRKVNDDAVVMIIGLYNPVRNLRFTAKGNADSKELNVSDVMNEMIDFCNVYLLKHTMNLERTVFVDAKKTNTNGFGKVELNVDRPADVGATLLNIANETSKQYANLAGHLQLTVEVIGSTKPPCPHRNTTTQGAKSASCTTEGYTGDTICNDCGKTTVAGSVIPMLAHAFSSWTQTQAPTCTEPGEENRNCSSCGLQEAQSIPATGHHFDDGTITLAPGCESEGTKLFSCTASGCSVTKTETLPATGHVFDEGTITLAPGCESEGTKLFSCTASGCSTTKTEIIPATGHDFDDGTVTLAPGCESEGTQDVTCRTCGLKTQLVIPATGHDFDEGSIITAPGCESEGVKAVTCRTCGKNTTEIIPPTGHDFDEGSFITAPGCESEGVKAVTCRTCGKNTTEIIPATGHHFEHYVPNDDATCTQDGTKTARCTNCSVTDTMSDPGSLKDHNYQKGICIACGAEKPASNSLWLSLIPVAIAAITLIGTLILLQYKKQAKK